MVELVPEYLERYIVGLMPPPDAALRAMEREGAAGGLPLIDRQVGRLLQLLALSVGAKRVLEIGTAIGYSTTWLARAATGGRVITLEIDPARAERARANLRAAGVLRRVEVRVGDAGELLESLPGPFDLIFNDGAKRQYPAVAAAARRLLRRGGLLVSDNALWGGQTARAGGDSDTRAVKRHNKMLMRHPDFVATVLPVRDGVLVARRT